MSAGKPHSSVKSGDSFTWSDSISIVHKSRHPPTAGTRCSGNRLDSCRESTGRFRRRTGCCTCRCEPGQNLDSPGPLDDSRRPTSRWDLRAAYWPGTATRIQGCLQYRTVGERLSQHMTSGMRPHRLRQDTDRSTVAQQGDNRGWIVPRSNCFNISGPIVALRDRSDRSHEATATWGFPLRSNTTPDRTKNQLAA
jgi:hypothetical protein